jgi:hypothetical protein
VRILLLLLAGLLVGCGSDGPEWTSVQDLDTEATAAAGSYISWEEHLIDDERTSGVPLRGASVFARGHIDGDEQLDILSAHTDSRYLRVAYSTEDPEEKFLLSMAELEDAAGIFAIAIGDVNGDDWADVITASDSGIVYLQNPGQSKPGFRWQRVRPTVGAVEWLSLNALDLNGDGQPEIIGLRPLAVGEFPAIVQLIPGDDPLNADDWTIEPLASSENAAFAIPGDMDGDGDLDLFAGVGSISGLVWFRNDSNSSRISLQAQSISVEGFSGEIHSPVLADLDGDGRLDVAAALETGLVMTIVRDANPRAAWKARTIGDLGPDGVAGLAAADIDGDGDNDLLVGAEGAGPSDADAERGEDAVSFAAPAGSIAWFQSPGEGTGAWKRHDMVRRERGRYSAFAVFDYDGDEDLDILGVRSNSGNLDGLFWIEQLHSEAPAVRFQPARLGSRESLALPLP